MKSIIYELKENIDIELQRLGYPQIFTKDYENDEYNYGFDSFSYDDREHSYGFDAGFYNDTESDCGF